MSKMKSPLDTKNYKELIKKLEDGTLKLSTAFTRYYSYAPKQKPWHYKEWKDKRAAIITNDSKCETCSNKGILVLQHTKQPISYKEALWDIKAEARRKYIDNFDFLEHLEKIEQSVSIESISVERFACPKCLCLVYYRKKRRSYYCVTKCLKEVDPITIRWNGRQGAVSAKGNKAIYEQYALDKLYEMAREYINNNIDTYKKEAFILMLNSKIDYLEFKNVKVLCKKCAFKEDVRFIPGTDEFFKL